MNNNRLINYIRPAVMLVVALVTIGLAGCSTTPTTGYSQYQLEYKLLAKYPDYFWCDPDVYPVARPGGEQANALQQFPVIMANTPEFAAIRERLALPDKPDYSDAEKLDIYRQHKLLTVAVTITPSGSLYNYTVRTGQNQGWRIEGTITVGGQIKELKKESSFNTCPICLTKGTFIDTPDGPVAVEELKAGMTVWTVSVSGERVAVPVIGTASTAVPASFIVVRLVLADGRSVTASPGHPTADKRPLGDYRVGDYLDNSIVVAVARVDYTAGATYDIMPGGGTGLYWANGILLLSTLP